MADVYVVVENYGGVTNEVSVYTKKEDAVHYIEDLTMSMTDDWHQVSDERWDSDDEDDDITIWKTTMK